MRLLVFVCVCCLAAGARQRWGRIEKEYSFRPFNLKSPDTDVYTHWRLGGSCSIIDGKLVFKPQSEHKSGYVWNQKPVKMTSWEVIIEFSVFGPAPLNGGEGMAFWVVSDPGTEGNVYGHSDMFNGLGIFFDSFDSTNTGVGEPYVLAMYNDGTKPLGTEGSGEQLGVCFADYRNLPHPARVKISFTPDSNGDHLTVGLDLTNSGKFKFCMSVKDVHFRPEVEHFGLTVGSDSNNFDVHSFLGINTSPKLDPSAADAPDVQPSDSESEIDDTKARSDTTSTSGHTAFSEHEHFEIMFGTLKELNKQLLSMEDEFAKHFASMFRGHNKNLEHHISSVLQTDMNVKNADVGEKVLTLATSLETFQQILGAVRIQIDSTSKDHLNDLLPQVKASCVDETMKGHQIVGQLKESVATFKAKQDQVFSSVSAKLHKLQLQVTGACLSTNSLSTLVLWAMCGAVLGSVFTVLVKKGSARRKEW